jgi:hypothetical protein
MGAITLFAIAEGKAVAFGERVQGVVAGRDSAGWRELWGALSCAFRPPYLTPHGRFVVDPHPLVDIAWHRSPDAVRVPLGSDVVPAAESKDVAWLLSYALLLTADMSICLESPHFAYGWTDEIPDRRLLESPAERQAHARIGEALFENPNPVPEALWFLPPTLSGPHAYLSPAGVRELVELETGAGVMKRLAERLQSETGDAYRWFGRDISRLSGFLELAGLGGHAVLVTYFAL